MCFEVNRLHTLSDQIIYNLHSKQGTILNEKAIILDVLVILSAVEVQENYAPAPLEKI